MKCLKFDVQDRENSKNQSSSYHYSADLSQRYHSLELGCSVKNDTINIQSAAPWSFWVDLMTKDEQKIKKPMFFNFNSLREVLIDAIGIYEDFKKATVTTENYSKKGSENEDSQLGQELKKLIMLLKKRKNSSFSFFEDALDELSSNKNEVLKKLKSSYSITQYANFTSEEEDILEKIITKAKNSDGI